MRIEQSYVKLSSEIQRIEKTESKVEFEVWQNTTTPAYLVEISDKAKNIQNISCEKNQNCQDIKDEIEISPEDKLKILLIEKLLSKITGKKVKFKLLEKLKTDQQEVNENIKIQPQNQIVPYGFRLSASYSRELKTDFSFSAKAIVKTQDSREISIDLNLNFSQSFAERFDIDIRFGMPKNVDPLVINFDGKLPSFVPKTFEFDIDIDSELDKVSLLSKGNGFLALDKNQNGKIDNGSELFGPALNDGFLELSQYDSDKNGWIDENDEVFSNLLVWIKTESEDKILKIKELNIGAIFLGNINSQYNLQNSENNKTLGTVQKTGIFLFESGKPGILQHIDIAI
uniref:VCBS repeat-containing protein n=1 Tax=Caldicellulosiruptor owensensis TaxID=55205 RepID=A0A7C5V1K0_9FIRM